MNWIEDAWNNGMGWLGFVAIIGSVLAFVAVATGGLIALNGYVIAPKECAARTRGMTLEHRYGFWGGCQVKTAAMGWAPLSSVIINAPEPAQP